MTSIRWAVTEEVGTITIARSEKKNALSEQMWLDLDAAARTASENSALRCVVLRGEGDAYSAGADIGEFLDVVASADRFAQNQRIIDEAVEAVASIPVPTIAVVRGACVGGGLAIALACDVRVADHTAKFGLTPARLGLVYGAAETARLVANVGTSSARRLLLTADIVDAQTAFGMGLVSEVVPDLEPAVEVLVARIVALSPYSTRAMKRILSEIERTSDAGRGLADELRLGALDQPDIWQRLGRFRSRGTGGTH